MKTLNPNTKLAQHFRHDYEQSSVTELSQAYGRYSQEKMFAQAQCKTAMYIENGYDFRILSWNTFQFTCGWKYDKSLRIETAKNSYIIPNIF